MARLVCMFNELDPRTRAALERHAPAAELEIEWADTSGSQQLYADELEKRWHGTEDLILVEQDKEIFGALLPSMLSCDQLWCGVTAWMLPVPFTQLATGGFSCVKFSAELQARIPVSAFRGAGQKLIDRRFHDLMLSYGQLCHLHGHVIHHHVYEPVPAGIRAWVQRRRESGEYPPAAYPEPPDPSLLPGSWHLCDMATDGRCPAAPCVSCRRCLYHHGRECPAVAGAIA